jgi:hypothetical protein
MRIGMWMGAPLRALGVVAVMALAACGGSDGDDKPALEVIVKVDGVADAAGPLSAGETSTVAVASGTTLVFDSPGETRWEPTASESSFAVNSFSFTSKSMTVSSNAGGTLVVVFTNKADASQKATLNVTVAPKEFERVAPREGEIAIWNSKLYYSDGTTTDEGYRTRATLLENGQYGLDRAYSDSPDAYVTRSLYDEQDGYLGWSSLGSSFSCLYDASTANVSYPMHVGKTWSGSATRTCTDGSGFGVNFTRTVAAFQRLTVAAGEFDTLRIESELAYELSIPSDNYTVTSTCWWAVQSGRMVKCDYVYHFPEGRSGPTRAVDELASTSN